MKSRKRFIRFITTDDNEVIAALDSIMSVEREGSTGIITLKDNTVYKAKALNLVLDAIESADTRVDILEERFGIIVESQPQFLNVVTARGNVLINANAIIKVQPLSETTSKIKLIGEEYEVRVKCSIKNIVATLVNVVPLDAVDIEEL